MSFINLYSQYITIDLTESTPSGEISAICPFHDDRNPSFSFNSVTGLWYCFSCNEGGNAYQFLIKMGEEPDVAEHLVKEAESPVSQEVVSTWVDALYKSTAALAFLSARGLKNRELWSELQLGFDGERVTIPIYSQEGQLLNVRRVLIARSSQTKPASKVINLSGYGSNSYVWPVSVLEKAERVYICEGEIDCLTALEQGLAAITGTHGSGEWRDLWSVLLEGKEVVICYDGDEAGRNGAIKVATSVAQYASKVFIVEIPDLEDVNSLHLKGVNIADLSVKEYTTDDPNSLVESLPENLNMQELSVWIDKFLHSLISIKNNVQRTALLKAVSKKVKVSVAELQKRLDYLEDRQTSPDLPRALPEPRKANMSLAQDYRDGIMSYCIWLPTSTGNYVPRIITSERKLEIPSEDVSLPSDNARWSVDSVTPNNVFAWLDGKTDPINTAELLQDICKVFSRFMWFPDQFSYDLLAAWVMNTYVFMIYDTTPYLTINSTKRAGKSRTLDLIEALAFNCSKVGSNSAAALFRQVEADRSAILFDEGDVISAGLKGGEGVDDRLAIILDGYKRSGKVSRYDPDAKCLKKFSSYSPKAFASMYSLPDPIVDRSIMVRILRKHHDLALDSLIFSREERNFQELRNKLYCWGLENASRLVEVRDYLNSVNLNIYDREYEIWHPILCLAKLVSDELFQQMLSAAETSIVAKKGFEDENSFASALIQSCLYLVKYEEPDEREEEATWYLRERIRRMIGYILEIDPDKVSPNRVANELVRVSITDRGTEYSRQLRKGNNRGKRAYRLDYSRILDSAVRFDVSIEDVDLFSPDEEDDAS